MAISAATKEYRGLQSPPAKPRQLGSMSIQQRRPFCKVIADRPRSAQISTASISLESDSSSSLALTPLDCRQVGR
ncbi:hypothetical protein I79_008792 [Cricetulus griseus]|uniref:Uncharacterized protein n=1 Tax=Cricetulus griseus TaxID=10029 RepID=G3HE22_CRIGR|nr:hypothetical protein I79_008792 [Cricetulus griseus]